MNFRGVVEQGQLERLVRAVTGLLEQGLGLAVQRRLAAGGEQVGGWGETGGHIRSEVISRFLASAEHLVGDQGAVDGVGERLAHPHIVQWCLTGIEGVVVGTELIRGIDLVRDLLLQFVVLLLGERFGDMQIARQIAVGGRALLIDRHEDHLCQHGMGPIPVIRVGGQLQLLVDHPVVQHKGTVAHQFAGLGPQVAVLLDAGLMERRQAGVAQQVQEVGHRLGEGHLQGVVIEGLDPQLAGRQFASDYLVHLVETGQLGKPGEGGSLFRVDQLAPAVDEVACLDRIAVGPARIRAQMEGKELVALVLPAGRHPGNRFAIRPLGQQPLEQIPQYLQLR